MEIAPSAHAPSTQQLAGRARSVIVTPGAHLEIGILSWRRTLARHLVDDLGRVIVDARDAVGRCLPYLLAGRVSPAVDLLAVDVATTPQPDRIRATVRMHGTIAVIAEPLPEAQRRHLGLEPADPVARFTPASVRVDWRVESPTTAALEPGVFAAARPDPLTGWESGWLRHLDADHRPLLARLVEDVTGLLHGESVRALLADSTGIVVRVYGTGSTRDVRIPFPAPVGCGCQAIRAFSALVSATSR